MRASPPSSYFWSADCDEDDGDDDDDDDDEDEDDGGDDGGDNDDKGALFLMKGCERVLLLLLTFGQQRIMMTIWTQL